MPDLTPSHFPAYFAALWGYAPFPWQARLAKRVCRDGRWPAALDLPTSAGKTAVIDIAVFHLALEADQPERRRAPVRIVYVVDRRLVVDSTYDRATVIARKLQEALGTGGGILRTVAERLKRLAGLDGRPLAVARLRGGMPRENDWARSPAQPLVLCSTVDQAGSRLLFRGYGVSDGMKPVHAGLLGSDALWLIDEAHLARPLVQTLRAVDMYRRPPWVEREPLTPLAIVELSATRRDDEAAAQEDHEPPFILDADDEENTVLRQRLQAHKPARLVQIDKTAEQREELVAKYVEEAERLAAEAVAPGASPVVGVVVNRVWLARAIADALRQKVQQPEPEASVSVAAPIGAEASAAADASTDAEPSVAAADVELIIGPSRPLDREAQLEELLPRMRAQKRTNARPLYVVATQTIEVGADLDFDALVTQIAPLDALRQRFGRLNRLGQRTESHAVILASKDDVAKNADDPVYGAAAVATWDWLKDIATNMGGRRRGSQERIVDFGIAHLQDAIARADLGPLTSAPADAPILFPSYVELWAQTSPPPAADPEPALFLHGPEPGSPSVTVVWRCEIPAGGNANAAAAIIDTLPPSSLEGVQVSLTEARRWLAGEATGNISDVEGDEGAGDGQKRQRRGAWRWDGKACQWLSGGQPLRPGDVLVARAEDGGCDPYGWNPLSTGRVRDWGERAALRQRRQLVLRVHFAALADELRAEQRGAEAGTVWSRVKAVIDEHAADRAGVMIAALCAVPGLSPRWGAYLAELGRADNARYVGVRDAYGEDLADGLILRLRRRLTSAEAAAVDRTERSLRSTVTGEERGERPESEALDGADQPADTDEEDGGGAARAVPLDDHVAGVERFARQFAAAAGLPAEIGAAVVLAAHLHDTGKAERRFQAFLRGGDLWLAGGEWLAKSGRQWSRAEGERIRQRVGLPAQSRHECWSVRLAECYLAQMGEQESPAVDRDLVRWLIGTHHGYGRPFFPAVADGQAAGEVRIRVERADLAADAGCAPAGEGISSALAAATLDLCASVDHGLTRLDAGWPDLFARLLRRYGPWELARLEAFLRLADHRESNLESGK